MEKRPFQGTNAFPERQRTYDKGNWDFYIAESLIGLTMGIICRLILGAEATELSVGLNNILAGIVFLCLSETFAYGTQLQNDVEGLV